MQIGLLAPANLRKKPRHLIKWIEETGKNRGHVISKFSVYQKSKILFLYGWGGTEQQRAIKEHKGHYVCFDLGYWDRIGLDERQWRVSINGFHCPDIIMSGPSVNMRRNKDASIVARSLQYNRGGHILLIGNAPKSLRVGAQDWSKRKCEELRKAFPDKPIKYRGKPGRPVEVGVKHDGLANGGLKDELQRASLVVTRHSNVAVDACQLGVPVICEDGAAAGIYPHTLKDRKNQPTQEQRQAFLNRLSWWQWSTNDMRGVDFWPWIERQIELLDHR